MIKQLEKIFPSVRLLEDFREIPPNYQWFISNNHIVIGIHKEELSEKDENILSTFLKPHNIHIPLPTEQEKKWLKRIEQSPSAGIETPFRFVYFSITMDKMDGQLFKEAINNLYSNPVPILWENEHEGIIIEEKPTLPEDTTSYEQIIDVLMSDLYVNIKFFIGPYLDTLLDLNHHYQLFLQSADLGFRYSDQSVVNFTDAIPYQLIDLADEDFLSSMKQIVLQDLVDDHELLHSIKVFIQNNLNVTIAAKKLHLHRNSLQYRLDKFTDKTGIDVRQFNEAMAVYLVILSMVHKD